MFKQDKEIFVEPDLRSLKKYPATVQGFAAWLATKPADRAYDYEDCENCLFAQFAKENGYWDKIYQYVPHPSSIGARRPWTFGAALTRAQAALERL